MKIAEFLLKHMDTLQNFFEFIDKYLDMGFEFLQKAKRWMEKILHYLEQAINTLAEAAPKRNDLRHAAEEHMFV